jgi:hypothetical protein
MTRKLTFVGSVICLLGWLSGDAAASWPSGGFRVISGKDCAYVNAIDAEIFYCPFVSDSDSYAGAENTGIYVDYHVSWNGDGTVSSACRQSWTGSSVACATGQWSSGTGNKDVFIDGYSSASGSPDVYDSYYVEIVTFDTVDNVWGLSHQ